MIAFEVEIDGEAHVVAGAEDWSILALHVNAARHSAGEGPRPHRCSFSVGALSTADEAGVRYHLRWQDKDLAVGSRVTVTVVDTERPDPPIRRYRSDAEVRESPFTEEELRELRRQDYLELKKEFEP